MKKIFKIFICGKQKFPQKYFTPINNLAKIHKQKNRFNSKSSSSDEKLL